MLLLVMVLVASTFVFAQAPPERDRRGPGMHGDPGGMPGHEGLGGPGERFHSLLPGKWWKHPRAAEELKLTPDQINKLEDIFLKYKTQMIDIKASMEKKRLELDNLLDKDTVDDKIILKETDTLIFATGELYKTYIRMLLDMKKILNPEQVNKLKEFREQLLLHRFEGRGDERGFRHGKEPLHQPPTPPPQKPPSQPDEI